MQKDISLGEYQKGDRGQLLKLARERNAAQKVVLRAKIVLKALEGNAKYTIAR